jgi:polysaccharide export outer membrane protein
MSEQAFGLTSVVPAALFLLAVLSSMTGCSEIAPEVVAEANSVQKDFLLGPEDVLEIAVWRNQDLTQKEEIIRPDGKISMPLLGEVVASGKTANQLATLITERLRVFKESPAVTVRVKEVNSYYVYVLGEVMKPGKYKLKSHATVLQSIAVAGGFTTYASKNKMQVLRTVTSEDGNSREVRIPARYSELVDGTGELGNFLLKTGDVVIVP